MKKVIKQETLNIRISNSAVGINLEQGYDTGYPRDYGVTFIEKSKAREVALAICPELGEPTIKTDNTKVILHLESELKEAVELIEIYTLQNREGYHSIISNDTYSRSINFLTKYKSKE